MAQKISTICDVCMANDEEMVGSPLAINLEGSGDRILDLCDDHRAELVTPLMGWLNEYSRPAGAPGLAKPKRGRPRTVDRDPMIDGMDEQPNRSSHRANGSYTPPELVSHACAVKGCDWKTTGREANLKNHYRNVHHTDYRVVQKYGAGPALAGVGATHQCDLRGCTSWFTTSAGFLVHLRSHDMTGAKAEAYVANHKIPEDRQRDLLKTYGGDEFHDGERSG